jgi:hypothetical protein
LAEGDKVSEESKPDQWRCRAPTTRAKNIATDTFVEEMRRKEKDRVSLAYLRTQIHSSDVTVALGVLK